MWSPRDIFKRWSVRHQKKTPGACVSGRVKWESHQPQFPQVLLIFFHPEMNFDPFPELMNNSSLIGNVNHTSKINIPIKRIPKKILNDHSLYSNFWTWHKWMDAKTSRCWGNGGFFVWRLIYAIEISTWCFQKVSELDLSLTHMNLLSFHPNFHFFPMNFPIFSRFILPPQTLAVSKTWNEEQVDGEATVKWMRRQAWCNGKVGVTGHRLRWVAVVCLVCW